MRPLKNPPPHRHPTPENVPIFGSLRRELFQVFELQVLKNRNIFEHWLAMRAQGFLKGTCLFGMSP